MCKLFALIYLATTSRWRLFPLLSCSANQKPSPLPLGVSGCQREEGIKGLHVLSPSVGCWPLKWQHLKEKSTSGLKIIKIVPDDTDDMTLRPTHGRRLNELSTGPSDKM